jgi:hypothetical protein
MFRHWNIRHPLLTWLLLIFPVSPTHFYGANNITKNAAEELKRLLQNSFQACLQQLYNRRQKCIVAQRDYKRNLAYVILLFCISQKLSDSENLVIIFPVECICVFR